MKILHLRRTRAFACALFLCASPLVVQAQTAPPLGTTSGFGVLGGSAVTNTGSTLVQGDVGVSPGTSITGFPPGILLGGVLHSADAVAAQAQSDLVAAFNNVNSQATQTNLTGQDLGGLTLTPGVYDFDTSAFLTGTLTLDAQGNPAAVFIFRTGSTLVTASASRVVVINGGSGCNVFWNVGSSATFGTASVGVGTVMALTSITLNTGASFAGRLLARNGAVTLDGNAVRSCGSAACANFTLTPASIPTPTAGQSYSQLITASGGTAPYVFSIGSGALPGGLSLSPSGASSALISGVPATAGNFSFSLVATDAAMCSTARPYSGAAVFPITARTIPAANSLALALLVASMLAFAGLALALKRD